MMPMFSTAFGVRMISPSVVHTHDRPNANTSSSATAATTPTRAARRPEAHDQAEHR